MISKEEEKKKKKARGISSGFVILEKGMCLYYTSLFDKAQLQYMLR